MTLPILEFRVAVTAQDYDRLVAFYEDVMGVKAIDIWTQAERRAV